VGLNRYIIRVHDDDELIRASKLNQLEILLDEERAKLEHVIVPISGVIAVIYDAKLVDELKSEGYELIHQPKTQMLE
jgi:hypothetical protein